MSSPARPAKRAATAAAMPNQHIQPKIRGQTGQTGRTCDAGRLANRSQAKRRRAEGTGGAPSIPGWASSLIAAPSGALTQPRHDQGDVVGLLDAALPVGEVREHAVTHLAGGAAGRRPGDGALEPLLAIVQLVIVVHLDDR